MKEEKDNFKYILQAIKEIKELRQPSGQIKCPKCGGKLIFTMAVGYNNHTHGRCETKNCINWME